MFSGINNNKTFAQRKLRENREKMECKKKKKNDEEYGTKVLQCHKH